MSPQVTRRKMAYMAGYLAELEKYHSIPFRDYIAERRAVERLLILLIQSAIDIVSHLLADRGPLRPDTYRELFVAAADAGLLNKSLARSFEQAAGLRNILIHEYEKIDDRLVWKSLPRAVKDSKAFLAAMEKILEK